MKIKPEVDDKKSNEAAELIQTLIKAKKNIRLYPVNNPVYVKTIDQTHRKFQNILATDEYLTLRIKQYEILCGTAIVYQSLKREENIALLFFKDGIRELTFKSGLPKEELEIFLRAISINSDIDAEAENDIVSLLWEKDLKFISYVVDESIVFDEGAEEYEEKATKEIEEKQPPESEILKAYADALGMEPVKMPDVVYLTDRDIRGIAAEFEAYKDKNRKFLHILLETLLLSEGREECGEALRYIKNAVVYCFQIRDLETVLHLLERINELLQTDRCPHGIRDYLYAITNFINSPQIIDTLGGVLDSGVSLEDAHIKRLAAYMGRLSIPPLISVLGNLKTIRGRKTIIRLLIDVGQKDINLLLSDINDIKWYVVRNILNVLGHIKDPSAKDYMVKSLRHADARVRREAVRALAKVKDSDDINIFKDALMDTDMSVRTAAVHAISRIPSLPSKEVIFGEIKKTSFSEKSFEEKKVFFEALSKWHDEDVVEFLLKRLKERSLFKSNIPENILLSVYSLGLMREKKAIRDIEKIKNTKDSALKEYAEVSIKRIIHGR